MKHTLSSTLLVYCLSLFCSPSHAIGTRDSIPELNDTKLHDSLNLWQQTYSTPTMLWGSTDIRYAKWRIPSQISKKWKGKAWKGERINGQAVITSPIPLKNAFVTASPLTSSNSIIPSSAINVSYVCYVLTDELNKDKRGGCGDRTDKTKWDSSLVADRLERMHPIDIPQASTRPIWIDIRVPQNAKPGLYRGTLALNCENFQTISLPYEILISNRALPAPKSWKFHLDLWQNPYSIARFFHVPLWSKEFFARARPTMENLASCGQKVITTTITHRAWNGQTEDPFGSMVVKKKNMDGSWTYDYSIFDQWVEFMMSIGIDKQINCYTLVPWAMDFDYYDAISGENRVLHAIPGTKEYENFWCPFLRDFASHLKEKGWFERTTIAMDERPLSAMKQALRVIRLADKEFKISGAMKYFPEIEPQIYDLCLAFGDSLPQSVLNRRKKEGKITTYYTCCAEAWPNTFSFSEPAEAAFLGWYAISEHLDGYLRWAYNSWTKDPLRDTRFRTWAAGDCFLTYPTGGSIRLQRLLEGIQDAEKIRLLREEFSQKRDGRNLQKLRKALQMFSKESLHERDASQKVKEGRKILFSF